MKYSRNRKHVDEGDISFHCDWLKSKIPIGKKPIRNKSNNVEVCLFFEKSSRHSLSQYLWQLDLVNIIAHQAHLLVWMLK
jgi:hypothetical protein